MVSVLNKIYEYIDVSTIFDVGPLFILCISFPIFVSLSLILFLLSYVKEPILEFAPSFSSLRGFVLSKSGCELHVLRSEEHTSELQSRPHLVCRLLLEKKKKKHTQTYKL